MNITLAALLLVSFTQPIIMVYRLGFSFADLFHLHTLLEINTAAASGRYVTHNFHTAAVTQVILVLVYLLPLIGGWNFIYSKKRLTRVLCICTVLPALLVLMTQNTKAAFIGSVLLFICSFITARLQKTGRFFKLTRKRLLMIIPAAAAFMLINYISFFLREGKVSLSLFKAINNKVFTYLLGQIPAFNHWFSTNTTAAAHTFGLKTFYAVPQALGLAKRAPGIYAEKFYNTNIYMAFRPLIEDFSSLGALLVLLAAGAVSGFCIERIRSGYARCLDLAFIAALYFYIFYAFITSPYSYVSYTLAAVLFLPYLLLMRRHIVLKRERL
jgi:oligosaccharide repeat unit polymerase